MPGAVARGRLAPRPMSKQPKPEPADVAVMRFDLTFACATKQQHWERSATVPFLHRTLRGLVGNAIFAVPCLKHARWSRVHMFEKHQALAVHEIHGNGHHCLSPVWNVFALCSSKGLQCGTTSASHACGEELTTHARYPASPLSRQLGLLSGP